MLNDYKVILWDFDGVILDSMPVRYKGFEEVLKFYPEDQVEQLLKYHSRNGGLSRYVKFRYFFEEIRKESVENELINELAVKFSEIMLKSLQEESLLINDSVNFIKNNYTNFDMHIVSGSDEIELNILCKSLGLSTFFKSIHGSPTPKSTLVKSILSKHNYDTEEVVLIGDSINDFEAARKNSIDFYGYNNAELTHYNYLNSFAELAVM